MTKYFYTTVLALALITAYAVSQTGSYPSSSPQSNPPQNGSSATDKSVPQSDQPVDDQALQSKVHDQLGSNPAFSNVNATVKDGVATLEGKVASKQDRIEAKKTVQSVPGVKSVKDKLMVEASNKGDSSMPPSSHWMEPQSTGSSGSQRPSGQTGSSKSDQTGTMPQSDQTSSADSSTLQTQIQSALKNEPTLSNDSISVSVTDSTIDLTGTAASKKKKQTAKRIAQSYAGNRKVQDHITVSGMGNSPTATSPDTTTPHSPDDKNNPAQNTNQTPPPDQTTTPK